MQDLVFSGSVLGKACLIKIKMHLGKFKLDGFRELSFSLNMAEFIPQQGHEGI